MPPEDEELSQTDELNDLNSVIVEPEAPEPDDDDDEDSGVQATPATRAPRKERRQQRMSGYNELNEKTARLERELQSEKEARARMEGLMQANLQRPQQQQGPHPLRVAVDEALREQDEFFQSYTAQLPTMNPQQREQAAIRARDLEIKKGTAMARLANAEAGIGQGPSPDQIRNMAFQEQLNMRYSDIAADKKASDISGHVVRRMFAEGKPQTWDTLDEAAEETRKLMGWKSGARAPKPSETTKAKFVGTTKGPGAGGSTAEVKQTRITKKQAQMAENAYPSLPPEKARQKWWNEVGKKYAP